MHRKDTHDTTYFDADMNPVSREEYEALGPDGRPKNTKTKKTSDKEEDKC